MTELRNRKTPPRRTNGGCSRHRRRCLPVLVAGVLLLAHEHQRGRGLPGPTVEEITAATGVSRSRADEVRDELRRVLPSVLRPVGRPPSPPREVDRDVAYALLRAVTAFIRTHPGCVSEGPERTYYGDAFRRYVLELREQHPDVELELMVDTYSGGFVGMSIREEEDSAAVTEALVDGIATTQEEPLGLLLDNKPSNHTDEVRAALGDVTIPIRATTHRPQNIALKTRRTSRAASDSFGRPCPRSTCAARPRASSPPRSWGSPSRPGRARSTTGRAPIAVGGPASSSTTSPSSPSRSTPRAPLADGRRSRARRDLRPALGARRLAIRARRTPLP